MYIITSTKKKEKKRKEKKMIYNTTLKDLIYLSVIFATVFDLGTTRKQRLFDKDYLKITQLELDSQGM